jgi:rhodanese-related sulfurtransferase
MFNGQNASQGDSDFADLVKNGAIIVDVRTPDELKRKNKVVITCCRSGSRSGVAMSMLKEEGLECYNGGPWNMLDNKI